MKQQMPMPPRVVSDWMDVPPVFVVGAPRSGTTLMRLMLTAHPNVSISSEGAHIYHLGRNWSSFADTSDPEAGIRWVHAELQPWLEKVKFVDIPTVEALREWVAAHGLSLKSLITFYGTWEARVLGKDRLSWWGDNAPYHVHHLPLFDALFPESRFLLMIRDPRDTCASGKRNLPWKSVANRAADWGRSLQNGLLARIAFGTDRVMCVRYEQLVTDTEEMLHRIATFLGIPYADSMLHYHESAAAAAIAALDHHVNVRRPVFASSIGAYRSVLTAEEIELVESTLFTPMFQLGYLPYETYRRALQKKSGIESSAE